MNRSSENLAAGLLFALVCLLPCTGQAQSAAGTSNCEEKKEGANTTQAQPCSGASGTRQAEDEKKRLEEERQRMIANERAEQEAEEDFQNRLETANPEELFELAETVDFKDRNQSARQAYRRFIERFPTHPLAELAAEEIELTGNGVSQNRLPKDRNVSYTISAGAGFVYPSEYAFIYPARMYTELGATFSELASKDSWIIADNQDDAISRDDEHFFCGISKAIKDWKYQTIDFGWFAAIAMDNVDVPGIKKSDLRRKAVVVSRRLSREAAIQSVIKKYNLLRGKLGAHALHVGLVAGIDRQYLKNRSAYPDPPPCVKAAIHYQTFCDLKLQGRPLPAAVAASQFDAPECKTGGHGLGRHEVKPPPVFTRLP